MKRITAFVLAAVLSLSFFALFASADGGRDTDPLTHIYEASDFLTSYVLVKSETKYGDGNYTTTYTYNDAGLVTKKVSKNPEGGTSTTTYTYDANLNRTKKVYKDSYGYTETEKITYDKNGNAVKHTVKSGNSEESSVLVYNSKGLLTKRTESDGYYSADTAYSYDKDSKLKKEVLSIGSENITTYSYNADGKLIKKVYKDEGVTDSTVYTYNSKGKLSSVSGKYSGGFSTKTTYKYDSKGRVIQEKTINDDFNETITYTYDSKGRLKKETYASSYGDSFAYINAYDSHGNRIKRTYQSEGRSVVTTMTYKKAAKPVVKADIVTMEYASAVYSGKAKKPIVSVEDAIKGADYRVIYSNNKTPGKATVTIRFTDPSRGDIKVNYKITPRKVTGLKAAEVKTDSIKVSWTKLTEAKAYKVEYSSDGKTWKSATVTANAYTLKNLKAGSNWQFRVKALDASKKIAGKTSAVLSVTTKK